MDRSKWPISMSAPVRLGHDSSRHRHPNWREDTQMRLLLRDKSVYIIRPEVHVSVLCICPRVYDMATLLESIVTSFQIWHIHNCAWAHRTRHPHLPHTCKLSGAINKIIIFVRIDASDCGDAIYICIRPCGKWSMSRTQAIFVMQICSIE